MTLREYIKYLEIFVQEYPEALDMRVIYAVDDEGNAFKKVENSPSFAEVDDFSERNLELNDSEEFNAVIIN